MTTQANALDLRERIVSTAAALFIERGYVGLSMREIAAAVGVSKAGLYYHFKDKEDLFLAVLLSNIASLEQLVRHAWETGHTIREQLHHLLSAIANSPAEQHAMMHLAEQDAVHLSEAAQKHMYQSYQKAFIGQIKIMLEQAQARAELKPFDSQKLTRLFLGMAYPLLSTRSEDATGMVDLMLAVFLEGAEA